ncbi:hypothetical protein P171DRAFT_444801 [Karstenula rhodostoma CBS 690.94]|uniref:Uncharacterized protein n=1 Tax=Karstenula rhodostoma CBS 690.94 TaxID=1392251 RepID=A0A9P4PG92_9PLEO|nr:hypothetical protein P171DRAFT_444801 [Karstenula rhodostoma CBS 690.94]
MARARTRAMISSNLPHEKAQTSSASVLFSVRAQAVRQCTHLCRANHHEIAVDVAFPPTERGPARRGGVAVLCIRAALRRAAAALCARTRVALPERRQAIAIAIAIAVGLPTLQGGLHPRESKPNS